MKAPLAERIAVRRSIVPLTGMLALWPAPADAHLVSTGLGPLYDGISHVLVTPEDLLAIVVLGLLAGMNGPAAGRAALFALPAAWLAGGAAALGAPAAIVPAAWPAVSLLVLGTLTALDRRLSASMVAVAAALIGLLHGALNAAAISASQDDALGLAGIGTASFVLVALAAAAVVSLSAPWARIAVRVAGSWVAAIGLLMAGWMVRAGLS